MIERTFAPVAIGVYDDDPVCSIDGLVVAGYARIDDLGREWGWDDKADKGWATSGKPRTKREPRTDAHGSTRSPAYRDGVQFTIGGYVTCPTPGMREGAELDIAGLCSDPNRLYPFRRRTRTFDHVRMVELDDAPLIDTVSPVTTRFQLTFFAPDPRRIDSAWQERVCNPAGGAGSAGLDYSDPGLDHSGLGLDYGVSSTAPSPIVRVANYGTAAIGPLLRITGPLSAGDRVLHRELGIELSWLVDIAAGEAWWINCDDATQNHPACPVDLPGHEVFSTTRGPMRPLLWVRPGWPVLDPSTAATFELSSTGSSAAELLVCAHSASF